MKVNIFVKKKTNIKESIDNSTFKEDKKFITDVFSVIKLGWMSTVPLDRYDSKTWNMIISDVRDIVGAENGVTVEQKIIDEYDDGDAGNFLYEWIRDLLDDVDEKAHDSKYEKYANTLSLLIYGQEFQW